MDERTRRSRERTDEIIVEHAAEYGEFRVRELQWELTPSEYERYRERLDENAGGGAGVWVTRDDAVLCVRHEGEVTWSEPGGKREPDESFSEAARREAKEESGVTVSIDGILEVHVITHVAPEHPPLVSHIVLFEGSQEGGEVGVREEDRVAEVRWFTERPDQLLYDALADFPMPSEE